MKSDIGCFLSFDEDSHLDAGDAVQDGIAGVLPAYRGTVHAVKSIIREEGWRALYAGLSPALLGSGNGQAT